MRSTVLRTALLFGLTLTASPGKAVTVQAGPDLKIISAIFGSKEGSIDLTSIVSELVLPGLNEFFATPKWLHYDPARYADKDLTIEYEFHGERRRFTVPEKGAVSYAILAEQAQPDRGLLNSSPGSDWKILAAYFGIGGTIVDVTDRVAMLIQPGSGDFIANASSMQADPLPNRTQDLIVTYEFEGKRRNFFTPYNGPHLVGYDILVENARLNGMATTHSNTPPAWLATAHPMSIADAAAFAVPATPSTATARLARDNANNPTPRVPGRAPHIESAITSLLSAQEALRNDSLAMAKMNIQSALTNSRATIAYGFPPEGRDPATNITATAASGAGHFEGILASLNSALSELRQATPGGKGQFLPDAISDTRRAMENVAARK